MKSRSDFNEGYYCAVATLIRMNGGVADSDARELARAGGDLSHADHDDRSLILLSVPELALTKKEGAKP